MINQTPKIKIECLSDVTTINYELLESSSEMLTSSDIIEDDVEDAVSK